LIGAELPKHPIDGKDIWPLLAGEAGAKSPQEAYYFYWGHNLHAVRSGQWKLHLPHDYRTLDGRRGGTGGIPTKYDAAKIELSLFDLESDPGELKNVADQHSEVVARLQTLAGSIQAELGEGSQRGTGQRAVGKL
jgi:arylsulfatase A-like enzyme